MEHSATTLTSTNKIADQKILVAWTRAVRRRLKFQCQGGKTGWARELPFLPV
jgi:hypothetical protein